MPSLLFQFSLFFWALFLFQMNCFINRITLTLVVEPNRLKQPLLLSFRYDLRFLSSAMLALYVSSCFLGFGFTFCGYLVSRFLFVVEWKRILDPNCLAEIFVSLSVFLLSVFLYLSHNDAN